MNRPTSFQSIYSRLAELKKDLREHETQLCIDLMHGRIEYDEFLKANASFAIEETYIKLREEQFYN